MQREITYKTPKQHSSGAEKKTCLGRPFGFKTNLVTYTLSQGISPFSCHTSSHWHGRNSAWLSANDVAVHTSPSLYLLLQDKLRQLGCLPTTCLSRNHYNLCNRIQQFWAGFSMLQLLVNELPYTRSCESRKDIKDGWLSTWLFLTACNNASFILKAGSFSRKTCIAFTVALLCNCHEEFRNKRALSPPL